MYGVELYAAVRLAVVDEGLSHHEAGRRFGIDRRTVKKMLSYSAPPGYRRTKPVRRPKLDGFTGIVDAILEADTDPEVPRKQRHTAHRIFERLRDEHGFTGGYTIVKDYVRSRRQSTREAFVPLHHPPGHAQVDFGEAVVELRGQREKVAFFCLILPHSNVWFVKAYPRETTEAFLDGHVSAFAFLGGVPRSILYDNTTLAVARILGDGTRRRTQAFSHLQSHYLFRDRFGRPGNRPFGAQPECDPAGRRLPALRLAAFGEALPLDLREHQHRRLDPLQPGEHGLRRDARRRTPLGSRGPLADEPRDGHAGGLGALADAPPFGVRGHHGALVPSGVPPATPQALARPCSSLSSVLFPHPCQRRRKNVPARRRKNVLRAGWELVPVVHGRDPRAGRRAPNLRRIESHCRAAPAHYNPLSRLDVIDTHPKLVAGRIECFRGPAER